MRVLKALRTLFEQMFPELRIEIKRKRHRNSITNFDDPNLAANTSHQRCFGKEKFLVVGVPNSPSKKKNRSNRKQLPRVSFDSIHKESGTVVPDHSHHMKHHLQKPWERQQKNQQEIDILRSKQEELPHPLSREKYERRRSSATRRQSMFGAFLFDFVCRRQMEAAMQDKNNQNQRTHPNRRPHLASIASPLTSPGREYEYNDNDDNDDNQDNHNIDSIHYDSRKHAQSLPNSPDPPSSKSFRSRSDGLSTSWKPQQQQQQTRSKLSRSKSSGVLKKRRQSMITSSDMKTRQENNAMNSDSGPDLIQELRQQYDPTGEGQKNGRKDLYTDKALLQREALRFDENVIHELNRIWKLVDTDNNHEIDYTEFSLMHHKLFVLYHGHLDANEMPTEKEENKMLNDDWRKDVAPLHNFDFITNMKLDEVKFNNENVVNCVTILDCNYIVKMEM